MLTADERIGRAAAACMSLTRANADQVEALLLTACAAFSLGADPARIIREALPAHGVRGDVAQLARFVEATGGEGDEVRAAAC